MECFRANLSFSNDYDIPLRGAAAIFSSNKSLIFGEFEIRFQPYSFFVNCEMSVTKLGSNDDLIEPIRKALTVRNNQGIRIVLPKPIFMEENVKYKIFVGTSFPHERLSNNFEMKQEVVLKNGAKITFHPYDVYNDLDIVKRGIIRSLFFEEIDF